MGQSVLELPDPLQETESSSIEAPGAVDDLLAQMAGAEIDRLLAESDSPREGNEAPTPIAEVQHIEPAPVSVSESVPAPQAHPTAKVDEPQTSVAEREALAAPLPAAPISEHAATAELPLPFYLRPFDWLSRPLDALSESARETIGKIALLTMFNAVAVLLYVLVFRKHRP